MRVTSLGAEQGGSRGELRALALAALVLALLAVVGLASSASAWRAPRGASAPTTAMEGLAATGGVVLVVALLLVWVETPTAPSRRKRRTPGADELDELGAALWTGGKTLAVGLLAVAFLSLASLPLLSRSSRPSQGAVAAHLSARAGLPRSRRERSGDPVNLGWLLLPIAVSFTILAPAAVLIRRRRTAAGQVAYTEDVSPLGRAVRASIAALEAERDPRKAVLRAYTRMEDAFRDVDVGRARDETASEFLGRTTGRLRVNAAAAAALTERFEEARYSTHPITETDREQALASLRRVERELAARR